MVRAVACLAALTCGVAFAQPAFEIADVHVSPHSSNPSMRAATVRAGQFELRTATMLDLIGVAYEINPANIAGGPSWIETDRFDIIAKVPPNTPNESLKLMLQKLLADRFQLVLHKDTRPMTAYVLTAGKKPLVKQGDGASPGGCEPQPSDNTAAINGSFLCHNVTMAQFAETLETYPRPPVRSYIGANPVRDMTGLAGVWDFHIRWTGRGLLTSAGSDGITLFDAVDKQLGLKLDLQKAPIPVIVVDSVNEKPTENLPGVSAKLPPLPMEFEVADIKPSQSNTQPNLQIQPGGRIDARAVTLQDLIEFAWNIDYDDMVAGLKTAGDQRYDIVAKAPNGVPNDNDSLSLMVKALLVDRFRLTSHFEDQPVNVYALVAVNPATAASKLKKADPSNRAGCKYVGGVPGGAASAMLRLNICQNVTMAQFADWLDGARRQARTYMEHPIVDATGVNGARDFTLTFSSFLAFQNNAGGRGGETPGTNVAAASDPNGAIAFGEALEKQLGLKLELRKQPMPVLMIDHVEPKPTEN